MARSNRSEDTTPDTPKARKAAEPKPETVRSPEYVNAVYDGEPVIVWQREPRVYQAVHVEHSNEKSQDGRPKFIRHPFTARPGLSRHNGGLLKTLTANSPKFRERVEGDMLQIIGTPKDFRAMSIAKCEDAISGTSDLDLLQDLLEDEDRPEIVEALEDEIADLKQRMESTQDARREKRRLNRKARARRRRR